MGCIVIDRKCPEKKKKKKERKKKEEYAVIELSSKAKKAAFSMMINKERYNESMTHNTDGNHDGNPGHIRVNWIEHSLDDVEMNLMTDLDNA